MKDASTPLPRKASIHFAKKLAVTLALESPTRTTNAQELRDALEMLGAELDAPSYGSVFKDKDVWRFTGVRIKSSHQSNHAREIKVWYLL